MDIWKWYEDYEQDMRAAGQVWPLKVIDDFIEAVVDINVSKADALVPELHALKKAAPNPWMEVFAGHWELRHRLGNHREGETALGDVVALYERAHRADTAECPQSVCVTQDLCDVYSQIDGRGWVEERIAVCEETLSKIDTSWNCFQCLSEEQYFALIDKGEPEAALAFVRQQIAKMHAAGNTEVDGLRENEAMALYELGHYDEALQTLEAVVERSAERRSDNQSRETWRMIKLQILAAMGRDEDAWALLPHPDAVTPYISMRWSRALEMLLARSPERNSWQVGSVLQRILEQRIRVGAWRQAIEVGKIHIRLALQRGASWTARQALALAQAQLPHLRAPLGDDVALAELQQQIDTVEKIALPVAAEALFDWLQQQPDEGRTPEQEVEWLLQALEQLPEDQNLRLLAASALQACSASSDATRLLEEWVDAHPTEESPIVFRLLQMLIANGKDDRIRQLAQGYQPHLPHIASWYLTQLALAREDWALALSLALEMTALTEMQGKATGWMLAGRAAMQLKQFEQALGYWQEAIVHMQAQEQPIDELLWEVLTAASGCENWVAVRDAAAQLEMNLTGDSGPVEESWGWIRLHWVEDHEHFYTLAQRTGPVTARILQPANPRDKQRLHDRVLFDASLLNTPPEDEEEKQNFVPLHAVLHTLEPGRYGDSWFIDGPAPDQETFTAFVDAMQASQCQVWVNSNEDYQLVDPETEETLPGLYFLLAAPENMPLKALDALLTEQTANWPIAPHWFGLARAAEVDETRHTSLIERFQL